MYNFNNLTKRIQFAIKSPGLYDVRAEAEHALGITQTVVINGVNCEIDRRFVPIIVGLNNKGYQTNFCCSGHTKEELTALSKWLGNDYLDGVSPFIGFVEMFEFPFLPEYTEDKLMYTDKDFTKPLMHHLSPCYLKKEPRTVNVLVTPHGEVISPKNIEQRMFYGGMNGNYLNAMAKRLLDWVNALPVRS